MISHVPVVPQHTHWHVGGNFGQFPQDVVKCPETKNKSVTLFLDWFDNFDRLFF